MKYFQVAIFAFVATLFTTKTILGQAANSNTDMQTAEFVKSLYQHGVKIISDDSVFISDEVHRLLDDDQYRASFYRDQYNWQVTVQHLQKNDIKKAVWNMINLYSTNDYSKDKVVKSILTFDQMFKMEDVLTSAFYTYCYTDPEVGQIVDGKPVIKAPHILEDKLNSVKEIIYYMNRYKAGVGE